MRVFHLLLIGPVMACAPIAAWAADDPYTAQLFAQRCASCHEAAAGTSPDKIQPTAVLPEGIVRAPGSAKEYDAAKIAGNANPPDWFPDEHPAAPRSVRGDTGIAMACGSCHLMSGQGHPESADVAGMPAEYLIRQMAYYKAGTRTDDARMGPIARAVSDDDVRQAAEYFAALKPTSWVKVIETATPAKTFIATAGRHRQLHPDGGTEPIGRRILEIPADPFRTEIRDPHSGFIAYVPPGRGKVWMIPSVLINTVLALDVLLLGAAQGPGPTRSLAGIKTASCEFTWHAVANWKDGEPQAGVTPAKLSFKFEDINTDEGTARVVGPFGPSDIVVRLSRDTLHFMQSFRDGPLYVTTLIPRIARDGRVMAVHTRHEYTDVSLPGYTSRPEQYYGTCALEP